MKSYLQLVSLVLLIAFAFWSELPNALKQDDLSGFDHKNAMTFLNEIAKEPHETGSKRNIKLHSYLDSILQKFDFAVEKVETVYTANRSGRIHHSKTRNIIAKKKGGGSGVMAVMGHYDSAISAPGAADDGHVIASMLEIARNYTPDSLSNDLWLIFTDGEEMGMMGAHGLARDRVLDSIDVIFNFEARGNSGPSRAFEWKDGNYEMAKLYKKFTPQPISTSLSYEVYKHMPNGSDFTAVKNDIPGINMAMIDGFAYYHSPMDTPENLNKNSFYHAGSTMFGLIEGAKYGDLKMLDGTSNGTFFNFYGYFILYNGMVDYLIFAGLVLFILLLYRKLKRENIISNKNLLLTVLTILLTTLFSAGLTWVFIKGIKLVYPHYFAFYMGHFYNHVYYLVAGLGMSLLCIVLIGRLLLKKISFEEYAFSVLLMMTILSIVLLIKAPSAAYIFIIPSFIWSVSFYLFVKRPNWFSNKVKLFVFILLMAVGIGFWSNLVYNLFLVFSIRVLWLTTTLATLFISFLVFTTADFFNHKYLPLLFGVGLLSFGLVGGHLNSKPSTKKPVVSELNYLSDLDAQDGYWMATYGMTTEDNLQKLDGGSTNLLKGYFSNALVKKDSINTDPPFSIKTNFNSDSSQMAINVDRSEALFTMIEFDQKNIDSLWINNDLVAHPNPSSKAIFITGYANESLDISIKSAPKDTPSGKIYRFHKSLPTSAPVLKLNHVRFGNFTILKRQF